jgi:hypothetical protein
VESVMAALKDTPIPTILVIAGIVFLLLSIAGQLAGRIAVAPERQRWAAVIGGMLLAAGVVLYVVPQLKLTSPGTKEVLPSWRLVAGQKQGCNRDDIACTGGSMPDPNKCKDQQVRQIMAVCWSNQPDPTSKPSTDNCRDRLGDRADWCTYKSATPDSCKGQGPEGSVYECVKE